MALVPYNPQQQLQIAKFAYDEGKALYDTISKSVSSKRLRNRRRKRRRRRSRVPVPRVEEVSTFLHGQPEYAPNAVSSRIQQNYRNSLREYRITHSELVSDIFGSNNFSVSGVRINAANSNLFAWLSVMAPNFETYRFEKLKFYLKPQCSTSTNGSVMMAIDSDPVDPPPASKRDMMTYEGAARSAPWQESALVATGECLNRLPKYYVASTTSTDPAQLRLDNIGNLFVATSGQADTSAVSELWVEYTLVLMTPQHNRCNIGAMLTAQGGIASNYILQNIGGDVLRRIDTSSVTITQTARFIINAYCDLASTTLPDEINKLTVFVNGSGIVGSDKTQNINSSGLTYQLYFRAGYNAVAGDVITWNLTAPSDCTFWKIVITQVDSDITLD